MTYFELRKYLISSEGQGNMSYAANNAPGGGGGGGTITGANNGLSISTVTPTSIVLGQNVGQAGSPGQLLSNREIPLNTFSLLFSGIGINATANIIYKEDITKALSTPYLLFENSAGAELGRINFTDNNDTFIGGSAGSIISGGVANTGIGWQSLQNISNGQRNTAVGFQSMVATTTSGFNTAIGMLSFAGQTSGGGGNTGIGYGSGAGIQTGTLNTCLGISAGAGLTGLSSDNTVVGANAMNLVGAAGTVFSQMVVVGSESYKNSASIGLNLVAIGYNINSGTQQHGNNVIIIGANSQTSIGVPVNSTILGQGMDMQVSNTVAIGRSDQQVVIAQTTTTAALAPTSTLQVIGSLAMPIRFSNGNTTLTVADFTVIFVTAATPTCTLPVATTCIGRIYNIVAQSGAVTVTLSQNVTQFSGVNTTTVLPSTGIKIQATASGWAQIP
jgi:trimeric autotransporter adhesin